MALNADSGEILTRFMEQEDLGEITKPITFEKAPRNFGNLLCCMGGCMGVATMGITALLQPIQTFCPKSTVPDYSLTLDESSVQLQMAYNDCCCHLAHSKISVPLDKIQDVQVEETWLHTIFGVKKVNVQTAGISTSADGVAKPEISAAFLREPEKVCSAIALAARLNREAMGAPGQARMQRNAGPTSAILDALQDLAIDGSLSEQEVDAVKVAALASDGTDVRKLQEMRRLLDTGRITKKEFDAVKLRIIQRMV